VRRRPFEEEKAARTELTEGAVGSGASRNSGAAVALRRSAVNEMQRGSMRGVSRLIGGGE
jgi:hypothetical protein